MHPCLRQDVFALCTATALAFSIGHSAADEGNGGGIAILTPEPHAALRRGQHYSVVSEPRNGFAPNYWVAVGIGECGDSTPACTLTVHGDRLSGELTVPRTAVGRYEITVMAIGPGSPWIDASIPVVVEQNVTLKSIKVDRLETLSNIGGSELRVTGVFSDGTVSDITNAPRGTSYGSEDAEIASVDANGHVFGHRPGRTSIRIKNGDAQATVPVECCAAPAKFGSPLPGPSS